MKKIFNKFAFAALAFFTILLFQNTALAQARTEFIVVADRQADCAGVAPAKCLQIKKPQDTQWQMLYNQIENFRYEPGYFYLLQVSKTEVRNPPADASRFKHRLRKIIDREKSENPANGNETNGKLSGVKWVLDKIEGVKVNGSQAYINFDESKNSFGGKGGCNSMGGNLKVEGAAIDMSNIFSTKMFCQETSKMENSFLAKLDAANRFEVRGEKLLLFKDGSLILELIAAK